MRPAIHSLFGCVLLALVLAMSVPAMAQDADIAALMAEIGDLADEAKENDKGLQIALQEEKAAAREEIALEPEKRRLEIVSAEILAEWAALDSEYGGSATTVNCLADNQDQYIADCESRRIANNSKVAQNNSDRDAVRDIATARSDLSGEIKMRRERAGEIARRKAFLNGQLAALRAAKAADAFKKGTKDCEDLSSNEAASRCKMNIWDGARSANVSPELNALQPPVFSMTPRRTAEEAIAAYKGSGAMRPLPRGFRQRALEPPSPK